MELDECPCSGKTLARLIRPAVLFVLIEEDLHGYEIVQRLNEFQLVKGYEPDATGVYRTLRSMEEMSLVESEWVLSEAGPAKRRYAVTANGIACAQRWMMTLSQYHEAVGALLKAGRKTLGSDAAKKKEKKKNGKRARGKAK